MPVTTAQVTLVPDEQTFEIVGNESILEAGLRAGLPLPYGCSNGTCGDCKCRVVSGEVVKMQPHDYMLSSADRAQGYVLSCSYAAVGDITLEVPLGGASDIPEQTIKARVREVELLGERRIAVHLITSRAERMRYLAGQKLEITVNGESRLVPAASCPCDERRIEVHVLCDAPAETAQGPYSSLVANAQVSLRGPFGSFVLDDSSERPIIMVAEGAGFAQIKSILQHALSLENAPSILLVRQVSPEGSYQENQLKSYANALDHFRYVTLAADSPRSAIMEAIAAEAVDLSDYDIYTVGSPDFVEALRAQCRDAGLPDSQWHCEVAV
ncbi:MAG TPA: 2Fe-2S iron-sulfur cluster-binding protein [Hyphomicrobiaceae bacterium]|nr:2Fe-2S iron-sulfur cluster-binding protein [Hyphomicrobiaceae bacterium]